MQNRDEANIRSSNSLVRCDEIDKDKPATSNKFSAIRGYYEIMNKIFLWVEEQI